MTPEDILLESIAAASLHGDSPALRRLQCAKLNAAILKSGFYHAVPFESDYITNGSADNPPKDATCTCVHARDDGS